MAMAVYGVVRGTKGRGEREKWVRRKGRRKESEAVR